MIPFSLIVDSSDYLVVNSWHSLCFDALSRSRPFYAESREKFLMIIVWAQQPTSLKSEENKYHYCIDYLERRINRNFTVDNCVETVIIESTDNNSVLKTRATIIENKLSIE